MAPSVVPVRQDEHNACRARDTGRRLDSRSCSGGFPPLGTGTSPESSNRLDQIVDVFYVQDVVGVKVTDSARLDEIRRTLASSVDEYVARVFSQNAESPVTWLSSLA